MDWFLKDLPQGAQNLNYDFSHEHSIDEVSNIQSIKSHNQQHAAIMTYAHLANKPLSQIRAWRTTTQRDFL